jgi:hypothetical protein
MRGKEKRRQKGDARATSEQRRIEKRRGKLGSQKAQAIKRSEAVLQGTTDKLIEIGRCYGMEINVEKTKVMRISRQPNPVTIKIDQKQLQNVK